MAAKRFIVEVEPGKEAKDGRPSVGPVYMSLFAKDGFPKPIEGLDSCWDIFRYRVARPRRCKAYVGIRHRVTKDDAMKWFQMKYEGVIVNKSRSLGS